MGRRKDGSRHPGGAQPRGTWTLWQVLSSPALQGVPATTARAHFAQAYVGQWLPQGKRRWEYLYDKAAVRRLLRELPARRKRLDAKQGRPRLRKRPEGEPPPERGLPSGWATLAQIARRVAKRGAPVEANHAVLRQIRAHQEAVKQFEDELGHHVIEALRMLAKESGPVPRVLVQIGCQKRVVDGRLRWVAERDAAVRVLSVGAARRILRDGADWQRLARSVVEPRSVPDFRALRWLWGAAKDASRSPKEEPHRLAMQIRDGVQRRAKWLEVYERREARKRWQKRRFDGNPLP